MLRTISIVSTQMQLVNSIEYIKKYNNEIAYNDLIICAASKQRTDQIQSLLSKPYYLNIFSSISFLLYGGSFLISHLHNLWLKYKIKFLLSKSKYDIIIIGNYLSIHHRFSQFIAWRSNPNIKFVLVDDGTATAESVVLRDKEKETKRMQYYMCSRFLKMVFYDIEISFKKFVPNSLLFFTVYTQLDFKHDVAEKNNYFYLKSVDLFEGDSCKFGKGISIIIGQPVVEVGLLSKVRYNLILLSQVKELHKKNHKIVYVPHPAESQNSFDNDDMKDCVTIFRPDVPLEMWVISTQPSEVIGFCSSALINIHYLLPDINLTSLFPEEVDLLKDSYLQSFKEAYAYISNIGVKMVCV